jgi:hypothetical protein
VFVCIFVHAFVKKLPREDTDSTDCRLDRIDVYMRIFVYKYVCMYMCLFVHNYIVYIYTYMSMCEKLPREDTDQENCRLDRIEVYMGTWNYI